jgi:hypothetical protein
MKRMTPPLFLINIASGKNVLLLFVLFMSFTAGIMPALEADIKVLSGGTGVIDLEFFYTPEKAKAMLDAYGQEGIRLYLVAQWTVDFIFPIIGFLLFATTLIYTGASRWFWLAFVMMAADWTENVFVTIMLIQHPDFHPLAAILGCVFTVSKWLLIAIMNLLVLYHGGKKLLGRFGDAADKTALRDTRQS